MHLLARRVYHVTVGVPAPATTYPTDVDWQRLVATIGRLAERLDDAGRDDLLGVLDFIERLAAL